MQINRAIMALSTPDTEINSMTSSLEKQEGELPDWTTDPSNAQNWSLAKKLYNTSIPSLLCLLMLVLLSRDGNSINKLTFACK